jgi:hypothetical protein
MAEIISKYIPGYEAAAEVTTASVDNLKLIHMQKTDLGFALTDAAVEACNALEKFKIMGKVPLRVLSALYPFISHIVTVDGFVKSPSAALRGILRHCGVQPSTPHSGGFARLASGAFYEAISLATFYEIITVENPDFPLAREEIITGA